MSMRYTTRLVIYPEELTSINSNDPSIRRSFEVMKHINRIIPLLEKTHVHQTMQGADLPWEAASLKATWDFDHVRFDQCKVLFLARWWLWVGNSARKLLSRDDFLFGITFCSHYILFQQEVIIQRSSTIYVLRISQNIINLLTRLTFSSPPSNNV